MAVETLTPSPAAAGRRRVPLLIRLCIAIVVLLAVAALFANWIAPYDHAVIDLRARLTPPAWFAKGNAAHLLGTDELGRDMLSRLIWSIRTSLTVALLGSVMSAVLGTFLGFLSAHFRGWIDELVMAAVDIQAALPFMILALAVVAFFGSNIVLFVALMGIYGWERYARLTRAMTLSALSNGYAVAVHTLGASPVRIYAVHILPNIANTLIVMMTLNFPQIVLLETSLSFLGVGIQPPMTSLGNMVGFGRDYLLTGLVDRNVSCGDDLSRNPGDQSARRLVSRPPRSNDQITRRPPGCVTPEADGARFGGEPGFGRVGDRSQRGCDVDVGPAGIGFVEAHALPVGRGRGIIPVGVHDADNRVPRGDLAKALRLAARDRGALNPAGEVLDDMQPRRPIAEIGCHLRAGRVVIGDQTRVAADVVGKRVIGAAALAAHNVHPRSPDRWSALLLVHSLWPGPLPGAEVAVALENFGRDLKLQLDAVLDVSECRGRSETASGTSGAGFEQLDETDGHRDQCTAFPSTRSRRLLPGRHPMRPLGSPPAVTALGRRQVA